MTDRYKLLKDISYPGCFVKADTEGIFINQGNYYSFSGEDGTYIVDGSVIDSNKTWFQKIEEKLYTEEDMRRCWETSRVRVVRDPGFCWKDFDEYLQSLNNK